MENPVGGRWLTQQLSTVVLRPFSFLFHSVHGCSHMQHVEHKLFQEAFTSDPRIHYLQRLACLGECGNKLQSLEFMWTVPARTVTVLFSKGCFSVKCLLSLGRSYRAIHIYRTHCFCGVLREQLTVETMNRAVLSHSTLLTGLVPVKIRPIWLSPEVPSNANHASSVASANDSCLALWNVKMLPVFRVIN